MGDTNYIGGIAKILEIPKRTIINTDIPVVKVRVQLAQVRQNRIVNLVFWGNLARDIPTYYKINDYILIEGYISLRSPFNSESNMRSSKKVEITILKAYPFFLSHPNLKERS